LVVREALPLGFSICVFWVVFLEGKFDFRFGYDRGFGEWVVAFIELPRGYHARDVDLSSITLQVLLGSVPVSKCYTVWGRIIFAIFDRADVVDLIVASVGHMAPYPVQRVKLVVMGDLFDGNVFRGKDTISVFFADH